VENHFIHNAYGVDFCLCYWQPIPSLPIWCSHSVSEQPNLEEEIVVSDKYARQAEQKRHFKDYVLKNYSPIEAGPRKKIPQGEKFTIDGNDYHVPKSGIPQCYQIEGVHRDWEE